MLKALEGWKEVPWREHNVVHLKSGARVIVIDEENGKVVSGKGVPMKERRLTHTTCLYCDVDYIFYAEGTSRGRFCSRQCFQEWESKRCKILREQKSPLISE